MDASRRLLVLALACAAAGPVLAAPLLVQVQDAGGRPVAGAVVVVSVSGAPTRAAAGTSAAVAQQGRQFVPQVTVVQTGTAVSFPNLDAVRHHVYSFSPAKTFELKLYAGTPLAPIVFDRPGLVVLGCNIHDRMTGWVVVVDTPYHATSDAAGAARLELPDGEHRLRVWLPAEDAAAAPVERAVRGGTTVQVRLPTASAGG